MRSSNLVQMFHRDRYLAFYSSFCRWTPYTAILEKKLRVLTVLTTSSIGTKKADMILSETALNLNMIWIDAWSRDLKLKINIEETKLSALTTDQRNRQNFHPKIRIFGNDLNRLPKLNILALPLIQIWDFPNMTKKIQIEV